MPRRFSAYSAAAVAALTALSVLAPVASAYETSTITGYPGPVRVAVSPDGSTAMAGEFDFGPGGQYFLGALQGSGCPAGPFSWDTGGYRPYDVAFAPDGSRVYVASTPPAIVAVNPATCQAGPVTGPLPDDPYALAVNATGDRLYTANSVGDSVSIANPLTGQVIRTVSIATPIGNQPEDVAVSPDGQRVYVAAYGIIPPDSNSGSVWSVDPNGSTSSTSSVAAGYTFSNPTAVAFSPDSRRAYVTNSSSQIVTVIDTGTDQAIASVNIGRSSPADVAPSADGAFVYTANQQNNSVSVIDAATNQVKTTIELPAVSGTPGTPKADSISLNPAGTMAWVTDRDRSLIFTVRLGPGAPTGLAATASTGSASIAFTPGSDNGAAVTAYQYSVDGGAWTGAGSAASPVTVSGLKSGTGYSVRLRALNGQAPGDPSAPVTFTTSSGPSPRPGATVKAGKAKVQVGSRSIRIKTPVTLSAAGTVSQVARQKVGRRSVTRCRTFVTARSAGKVTLTCRIGSSGRRDLRRKSMTLTSTFTLKTPSGSTATSRSVTKIKRRR